LRRGSVRQRDGRRGGKVFKCLCEKKVHEESTWRCATRRRDAPQKPDVTEAKIREVFTDVSGEKFGHIYLDKPFTVRGSVTFAGEDPTNEPTKVMVELARKAGGHTICW